MTNKLQNPIDSNEIKCKELNQRLQNGDEITLLDCRELWECEVASIRGSHAFPLSEFSSSKQDLESFRESEVVVICHHGVRSLQLTMWMVENGFSHVKSLRGGIDRWSHEIDPSVPRY